MAKVSSIVKNNKRIVLEKAMRSRRSALKKKIRQKSVSLEERFPLILKLAKLPRNSASNRVRNRCALTGRSRGFCRKMGVSRIMLRSLASNGMCAGLIKSSW